MLGVGDFRGERGALLQDGPELFALLGQLVDLSFQLGDEVAGVGGGGDEVAVAGEAPAAINLCLTRFTPGPPTAIS